MKRGIWTGFLMAILVYIVTWVIVGFLSAIVAFNSIILLPITIVGLIIYAIYEMIKKQNRNFGLGIILGVLFPLLIFGACLSILALSF